MFYLLHRRFLLLCLLLSAGYVHAQTDTPFLTKEYVDINNIKAAHLVRGDMWENHVTGEAECRYPANSKKNIGFVGALWMAGYDAGGQLRAAAQTYRQDGNDYWPGPIVQGSGPISYADSKDWAKIWKIHQAEINTFLSITNHTTANTPAPILEWPAKGNPYAKGANNVTLTINNDLAPFVDVNSDGQYDPLAGDYPKIKGDQMLWNVFNDHGPSHAQTDVPPMQAEVQCMAYAYHRNSPIDNIIFYEYKLTNFSGLTLDSTVIGFFADMDLGAYLNDFIGYDSARNLGYIYCGTQQDIMPPYDSLGLTYGDTIPMAGIRVLMMPGDNCGNISPASSFMYYNNNSDIRMGNPSNGAQFNNYLRHRWRNGDPLVNDYQGPGIASLGWGVGPQAQYVYPGDPNVSTDWSECSSGNTPYDRRVVISSQPFTWQAGTSTTFAIALVASPRELNNGCPSVDLAALQVVADTAQKVFCDPLPNNMLLAVPGVTQTSGKLKLYPNPAKTQLTVEHKINKADIKVHDALGRLVQVPAALKGNATVLDVAALPGGVYHIVCEGSERVSASFVKE